jgi:hypothetical protein
LFVPLMIAVPFGPLLAWKRGDLVAARAAPDRGRNRCAGRGCVLWAWTFGGPVLAPLAIGLAAFVIAGAASDIAERIGLFRLAPPSLAAPRDRPAALGLGHGLRACRARPRAARHRLRDDLEQRNIISMQVGSSTDIRRLQVQRWTASRSGRARTIREQSRASSSPATARTSAR